MKLWLGVALAAGIALPGAITAAAADPVRVAISDPFIELHSGPGRGYPVFHVFERGEQVEIVLQRTDWFKLRDARGTEGWAAREQLQHTFTDVGSRIELPPAGHDDYQARRFELGPVGGVINGDSAIGLRAGYHFNSRFVAEAGFSHIPGDYSNSRLVNLNLIASPFEQWRLEPVLTAGIGYFENDSRPTLVGADSSSGVSGNVGVGLRSFVTRNFLLRADLRRHSVRLDAGTEHLTEATAGFAAFF